LIVNPTQLIRASESGELWHHMVATLVTDPTLTTTEAECPEGLSWIVCGCCLVSTDNVMRCHIRRVFRLMIRSVARLLSDWSRRHGF